MMGLHWYTRKSIDELQPDDYPDPMDGVDPNRLYTPPYGIKISFTASGPGIEEKVRDGWVCSLGSFGPRKKISTYVYVPAENRLIECRYIIHWIEVPYDVSDLVFKVPGEGEEYKMGVPSRLMVICDALDPHSEMIGYPVELDCVGPHRKRSVLVYCPEDGKLIALKDITTWQLEAFTPRELKEDIFQHPIHAEIWPNLKEEAKQEA